MSMNAKYCFTLIFALALPAAHSSQEQRAEVGMSCLDLQFEPAGSGGFGLETTLTLGTGEGNGEVFYFPQDFTQIDGNQALEFFRARLKEL